MTVDGLDASAFQGALDWNKLLSPNKIAPGGFQFGIFRASYGTTNDTTFVEHANQAQSAGAIVIAYHFFSVLKPAAPQIQTLAAQVGLVGRQNRIVALDVEEVPPKGASESASDYSKRLVAWFNTNKSQILDNTHAAVECCVQQFGRNAILYTYPYYWQSLGHEALAPSWVDCPLWISSPTRGIKPSIPAPWPDYTFWQWTDDENVVVSADGYPGPHSLLDRYNGTMDDLIGLTSAM